MCRVVRVYPYCERRALAGILRSTINLVDPLLNAASSVVEAGTSLQVK